MLISYNDFVSDPMRIQAYLLFAACFFSSTSSFASEKPDWTYDDDYTGQEDWAANPKFELCENGTNQSPIVIGETIFKKLPPLKISPDRASGKKHLVDHTLEIAVSSKNTLVENGRSYHLKSIRFHHPSEHMIGERYYMLEIRMMFETADKKQLIIAVFGEQGKENAALEKILSNKNSADFALNDLLSDTMAYYSYVGSQTTPPCNENVQWRILKKPVNYSILQHQAIVNIIGRNTRLPQPLYFRKVYEATN